MKKITGSPLGAGELIKAKRLEKNLSHGQVGAKIGMRRQQLYWIENGLRPLPPEYAIPISRVLGIPLEDLISASVLDFKKKFESRLNGDAA